VAPNPKESPALPSHGVRTERRTESHGVDPSYPMGKQGPALLARFLFERYPYGPLALLLWVGPMTQRVDPTRCHFEEQPTTRRHVPVRPGASMAERRSRYGLHGHVLQSSRGDTPPLPCPGRWTEITARPCVPARACVRCRGLDGMARDGKALHAGLQDCRVPGYRLQLSPTRVPEACGAEGRKDRRARASCQSTPPVLSDGQSRGVSIRFSKFLTIQHFRPRVS
jgi:hypothetical protein